MKRLACALACAGVLAGVLADVTHAQGIGAAANADALAPTPTAPAVALTQRLDAPLPLQAAFTDSTGRALRLGDEFARGTPVILMLGYDRCPQLCGLLMQGLLEATRATGLPASSWRIVFASIDPSDTPADAAIRRRVALGYARFLDDGGPASTPPSIDFLVGAPASIDALTRGVGDTFEATPGAGAARFAHPAGIVIATPDGRVSRYLMGVRFDPAELRAALVEAGGGRIGTVSERIALMCAHVDPHIGRWSTAVLRGLRVLGLATMALLALLVWRRRARMHEEAR